MKQQIKPIHLNPYMERISENDYHNQIDDFLNLQFFHHQNDDVFFKISSTLNSLISIDKYSDDFCEEEAQENFNDILSSIVMNLQETLKDINEHAKNIFIMNPNFRKYSKPNELFKQFDFQLSKDKLKNLFIISTSYPPYEYTLHSYYNKPERSFFEIKLALINICNIYKKLSLMESHLHLSIDDVSLCGVRNGYSPYPKIELSFYSVILGIYEKFVQDFIYERTKEENEENCSDKSESEKENENEEDDDETEQCQFKTYGIQLNEDIIQEYNLNEMKSLNQQMVKILEYFDQRYVELGNTEPLFSKEINQMRFSDEIIDLTLTEQYKTLKAATNIPSINVEEFICIEQEEDMQKLLQSKNHSKKGKTGFVYQVKHVPTGKIYAMKETVNDSTIGELSREAYSLLQMEDPSIVELVGYKVTKYSLREKKETDKMIGYLCEEYCEFKNLSIFHKNYIKRQSMNSKMINHIFGQLAKCCLYIHKNNFCHRDIKPQNVLISKYDIEKDLVFVKMCDFGLARSIDDNMITKTGTIATIHPLVLTGSYYGDFVDLFSLGTVLYLLVYDEYPFDNLIHQLILKYKNIENQNQQLKLIGEELLQNEIPFKKKQINRKKFTGMKYKEEVANFEEIIEFLQLILCLDDNKRMNWESFEQHVYVQKCLQFVKDLQQ